MIVLYLAAASSLVGAAPIAGKTFGPSDYPQDSLAANQSAAALVELVVDPKGKIIKCDTLQEFGEAKLAKKICPLIRRYRWHPALDRAGQPMFGAYRDIQKMYVPETTQGDYIANLRKTFDFEYFLNRLPDKTKTSVDIKLAVSVDETGSVVDCDPAGAPVVATQLVNLACGQTKLEKLKSETDADGRPMKYIIEPIIRFSIDTRKPSPPAKP